MSGSRVISLGCRLNHAESERIEALIATDPGVVVVNSCAVTREAVRSTRQAIRRARKAHPDARLLVTGCAAETERDDLSAMDEVDGLVANASKLDPRSWNVPQPPTLVARSRTRAFLPVQNGCDHACTFCIIPQGRGNSRSEPIPAVLRAIEQALDASAKEVVLTGVDLTSWGHDLPNGPRLGTLVAAILDAFPDLTRLRLSSVDGVEIDDKLFELLANEPRVMPHLHLSLQHGADLMLKRMKRRHSRAQAISLVQSLKQVRPEIAVGADLIAGFPTETEEHHRENLSIIAECAIVHGHIFPYSPRHGTPAARMPQLDGTTIKRRAGELRAATRKQRDAWLESLIGRDLEVLAEKDGTGHAPNFARVAVPEGMQPGMLTTIRPTRIIEGLLA